MRPLLLLAVPLLALVATRLPVGPPGAPSAGLAEAPGAPVASAAPGGKGTTVPGPDGGGTAGVRTTLTVAPYRVEGATHEALLESLRANGPHVDGGLFFGLTTTEMSYRFAYAEASTHCAVSDASVDLTVTITLPEWPSGSRHTPLLARDWTRFASALRRHEEGHRDLAIEGAHRLRTALADLRAPTCTALNVRAADLARWMQQQAEAAHHAYDASTGHGETEGAVWPPQG